jgi:hypothetical protein
MGLEKSSRKKWWNRKETIDMDIFTFQDKYTTKEAKKKALSTMTEKEVNTIIESCGTPQGKSFIKKLWRESNFRR